MLELLSSEAYKTLLMNWNDEYKGGLVIDVSEAEALYRTLSNITHGKWSTFESTMPDRFSHNPAEWTNHVLRIEKVEDMLLKLLEPRFPGPFKELLTTLPALRQAN